MADDGNLRSLIPEVYVSPAWVQDNPRTAAVQIEHLKRGLRRLTEADPLAATPEHEVGARRVYALAILHGDAVRHGGSE